jgi:Flp pilus assembly protein protease CpaA
MVISVIGAIGAALDLVFGKIYNAFNLPVLLIGWGACFALAGFSGLGLGVLGAVLGLVLYGWMFALGQMGGGDVKFLMALGAWGGPEFVAKTAILGVLVGGAIAVVQLGFRGKLAGFIARMQRFVLSIVVRELEVERPKIDRTITMAYGVPIAASASWIAYSDPFVRWGIRLWS